MVRYRDPNAGNTVRQLLARAARKEPDPRVNLLVDLGLILRHGAPIKIGETLILDRIDVEEPTYTLFLVQDGQETVFEVMVTPDEIEIGHYESGAWEAALQAVSSLVRSHPAFTCE